MDRTACTEPQCLYSKAIPLFPPYGPYGLYRASVPVQYSYTSTPPLWALRPVQSLSACTVQLYLYPPYGPYGVYRASVRVQGCTLPFSFICLCIRESYVLFGNKMFCQGTPKLCVKFLIGLCQLADLIRSKACRSTCFYFYEYLN